MAIPHINTADGSDALSFKNVDSTVGTRFDAWGRPRQGTTTGPSAVVIGAGAGTGAAVTSHTGTDSHGNVLIQTGTTPAAGTIATITFGTAFTGTNPPVVQIEPKDAGAVGLYYANCTNTTLTVKAAAAVVASVPASFDYFVVGGA